MRPIFIFFAMSLLVSPVTYGAEEQGLVLPFKQVTVGSTVLQDIISRVLVEEGDTVKEGQELVLLMNQKEKLEVEQYAKLIERREFEAKAWEKLFEAEGSSKDTAMEKKTELELAKINHKLAIVKLEEKTIRAPISGIVVKKYKEAGEGIDRAEKLVDIINIDRVFVQFYLDPALMDKLRSGEKIPVRFPTLPSGEQEFTGVIDFIDSRIDSASVRFRVKVLIENPGHRIKAGMRGQADFTRLAADAGR